MFIKLLIFFILFTLTNSDNDKIHLIENKANIGMVRSFDYIDSGNLVIYDNNDKLHHLVRSDENYNQELIINKHGNGPCEYESVSDFTVYENQLIVLDNSNGKLLTFELSGGDCINEITDKEFTRFASLAILKQDKLVFSVAEIHQGMEEDQSLAYELDLESEEFSSMPVAYENYQGVIKDINFNMPMRAPNPVVYVENRDKLLFYFSTSEIIHALETDQNDYHQMDTGMQVPAPPESANEMLEYMDHIFLLFDLQLSGPIVALGGRVDDNWIAHIHHSELDEQAEVEGRFLAVDSDSIILLRFNDEYDHPYYIESLSLEDIFG